MQFFVSAREFLVGAQMLLCLLRSAFNAVQAKLRADRLRHVPAAPLVTVPFYEAEGKPTVRPSRNCEFRERRHGVVVSWGRPVDVGLGVSFALRQHSRECD